MTNHSPPNNFFTLVTAEQGAHEGLDEHGMIGAEARDNQLNENVEELSANTSPVAEEKILEAPITQSDSAMPHDARRVLVHLMRQGSVMASQKSKLFELLCRHEAAIRKHLSEVYLQLILDQKIGVAFVARSNYQNDRAEVDVVSDFEEQDDLALDESTTLIPKRTLSLYDTLILLVLRKHYQDRESAGEQKITIDIERLESYLTPFLPITEHASKDRKKLLARVKEMVKRKILSTIRGTENRYEITPIIRYVVSASFLESMLDEYMLLAKNIEGGLGQQSHGDEVGEANE